MRSSSICARRFPSPRSGDAPLAWLNRTIGIATAARRARGVEIEVFSVR